MLTAHSLGGVMARQLIESFVNKTLAARHYELAVVCPAFHHHLFPLIRHLAE